MHTGLDIRSLENIQAKTAVLCAGNYALPVRMRVRGRMIECVVPAWCGVGDMPAELEEVLLVVEHRAEPPLRWIFIRGCATTDAVLEWPKTQLPSCDRLCVDDLYQLIRVKPKRMELVDEQYGWGYRETADF